MWLIDLEIALATLRDYPGFDTNTVLIDSIRKAYDGIVFDTSDHRFFKYWYVTGMVTELKDWKSGVTQNAK